MDERWTDLPSPEERFSVTLTFEAVTFKIPKVPFMTIFGLAVISIRQSIRQSIYN